MNHHHQLLTRHSYMLKNLYNQLPQSHHKRHRRLHLLNSCRHNHILHPLLEYHNHNLNHYYNMNHHHQLLTRHSYMLKNLYNQLLQSHHKRHRRLHLLNSCRHNHILHPLLEYHNHNLSHYYNMSHHRL